MNLKNIYSQNLNLKKKMVFLIKIFTAGKTFAILKIHILPLQKIHQKA